VDQKGNVFGTEARHVHAFDQKAVGLSPVLALGDASSLPIADPIRKVEGYGCAIAVPQLGWHVVFIQPMSTVMEPIGDHIRVTLISFGFYLASVAIIGFFWVRSRIQASTNLRRSHVELELRVEERTRQLRNAYDSLTEEMTQRNQAVERLRSSEELYRMMFLSNPDPMWVYDIDSLAILLVNNTAVSHYGYSREEFGSMTILDFCAPEHRERLKATVQEIKGEIRHAGEFAQLKKNGSKIVVDAITHDINFQGRAARLVLVRDVTDQKIAEASLRESEERFRTVSKATNDAIWDWDRKSNVIWWGDGANAIFGYPADSMPDLVSDWTEYLHPMDKDRVLSDLRACIESDRSLWSAEYRFKRADGKFATVLNRAFVIRDETGQPSRIIGAITDVTERRRLQEQLSQAQKMDSIGRLAGGVAHDFNNLLTIIIGYAEFAKSRLSKYEPVYGDVEEILAASQRASDLTRQLLAFARKQIVEPKIVNVNSLVLALNKMLRRVIGEHIELVTDIAPELPRVKIDPVQLEQVLINLAVNARDAMPDGGTLTIETSYTQLAASNTIHGDEIIPGDYLQIAVSDSGIGMERQTLEQVFEPFFTTKEVGKGTGLGLATCYGIIRQAGGYILVYSEPGRGTTFKVCLPCAWDAEIQNDECPATPLDYCGTETILVVEDEPHVREMIRKALEAKGYEVISSASARIALSLALESERKIDLLLTDVVMPQISGKELAAQITASKPEIAVLFMSGYAETTIAKHGILEDGIAYLSKPFTPQVLVAKVRSVLDEPNASKELAFAQQTEL
jgi:PAS domain S-box-containing protein